MYEREHQSTLKNQDHYLKYWNLDMSWFISLRKLGLCANGGWGNLAKVGPCANGGQGKLCTRLQWLDQNAKKVVLGIHEII